MVDETHGPEKENTTKDDKNDRKTPVPLGEKRTASSNAENPQEYEEYAQDYIKPAYKWVWLVARPWAIKHIILSSNFWIAAATVAIAATTIAYTVYARRQWRAMLDSNTFSQKSLEAVQRAFVQWNGFTIQGVLKRFPYGDQRFLIMQNNWQNSGSTPATGVIHYFHIAELPDEPSDEIFQGQIKSIKDVTYIGPKGALSAFDEKPISFYIGNTPITATREYSRKVFFWGWIIYRDAFPRTEPHITEVCKLMTAIAFAIPKGAKTGFPPVTSNMDVTMQHTDCESHNCEDHYCADYETLVKLAPSAK
jgi:hypothetical protein